MTRNRAAMAAWFVVIEQRLHIALLLQFQRQDHYNRNFAFENARGDDRYVEAKGIFDFHRSIFVYSLDIESRAIKFIELNASEKTIKVIRSNNQSHAGGYRLILDRREFHRSPGHQLDAGSLAEIFVGRSATRWLCLYG